MVQTAQARKAVQLWLKLPGTSLITIYKASVESLNWDICAESKRYYKTPTSTTVCSPCCHLAKDTELSASLYYFCLWAALRDGWHVVFTTLCSKIINKWTLSRPTGGPGSYRADTKREFLSRLKSDWKCLWTFTERSVEVRSAFVWWAKQAGSRVTCPDITFPDSISGSQVVTGWSLHLRPDGRHAQFSSETTTLKNTLCYIFL